MAIDYDKGEVSEREEKAAENQKEIAKYNASATKNQLNQQLKNYDFANAQNRRLADVELAQNSRKTESDRFEAARDLQNAALGLLGSMGNQAMNSSSINNFNYMLENRNDKDNNTYWTQHQVNQDAVNNAYDESANQNQVAKNDAVINTEKALKDMQADLSTNISNINPNLYVAPGKTTGGKYNLVPSTQDNTSSSNNANSTTTVTTDANTKTKQINPLLGSKFTTDKIPKTATSVDLGGNGYYGSNKVDQYNPQLSSYLIPDLSVQTARLNSGRNTLQGNDYYSRLLNSYNSYRRR